MEVIPEYDICEGDRFCEDARLEQDAGEGRTVVRLGMSSVSCDCDVQAAPEHLGAGDAVTVGLPVRKRVRFFGRLGARGIAFVTLVVLGAGVSVKLFRRPSGRDGVRHAVTTRRILGAPAVQRERGVSRLGAHHRAKTSFRDGAGGRQRGSVHRHTRPIRQATVVSGTSISGVYVRPPRKPSTRPEGDVPRVGGAPEADDAPTRAQAPPSPRRGPPCVPGTLGC
jgi:hypothetical protein